MYIIYVLACFIAFPEGWGRGGGDEKGGILARGSLREGGGAARVSG